MALHARGHSKPHKPKPKQRWRAPRRPVLDPQIVIRFDKVAQRWEVVSGDGMIIASDFETNGTALRVEQHRSRA